MRIDWSDLALDDIDEIRHYIAKDSPFYARQFAERVFEAADKLLEFPMRGRTVPEADNPQIRELIVQGYRLMYRIEADRLLILAVMHGSRDLSNPANQSWPSDD